MYRREGWPALLTGCLLSSLKYGFGQRRCSVLMRGKAGVLLMIAPFFNILILMCSLLSITVFFL